MNIIRHTLTATTLSFALVTGFGWESQQTANAAIVRHVAAPPSDLVQVPDPDQVPNYASWFSLANPASAPIPCYGLIHTLHPDWTVYWSPGFGEGLNVVWMDDTSLSSEQADSMQLKRPLTMDDSQGDNSGAQNSFILDTNALWLQITNVSNGWAFANLFNATNQVYAIYSTTDLLAGWSVETDVCPTNHAVMPFILPTLDRQSLFLRAMDWTGVAQNGNTIPDWWFWENFGTTALYDTNLDSQGNTLLSDYQNATDPNPVNFLLQMTNRYVNGNLGSLEVLVLAGVPAYYTGFVNDSNPASTNWLPFTATNLLVELGPTDGLYTVTIGLRGRATNSLPAFQTVQLIRDTVPPLVVITNPAANVTAQSMIQLHGYATKELSAVRYDISNALGMVSGQRGAVTHEYFDAALGCFTTNWFSCLDIPLTNGLSVITVRVTDWAGNVGITNFPITVDYSIATYPVVQVIWPPDGSQIAASTFTCRGTLDDPSGTVAAQITDTNGNVTPVLGVVGRDGRFWLENLPLSAGTNLLTINATNAAGLWTVTSLTLVQAGMVLTIDPIPGEQLWQATVDVQGQVSDTTCTVTVNGVQGVNSGNGTWYALNVPTSPGGVGTFDIVAQPGGSGDPEAINNCTTDKAPQIVVNTYQVDWTLTFTANSGGGSGPQPNLMNLPGSETYHLGWAEDADSSAFDQKSNSQGTTTTYYNWPADEYIVATRNLSSNGVVTYSWKTNIDVTGPPQIVFEHCNINTNGSVPAGTISFTRTADAKVTLVTGGKGTSNRKRLFQITGNATAITNLANLSGTSVPYTRIQMGGLGNLGTDGILWCVLSDNATEPMTPTVTGLNPDYYFFGFGQTPYTLSITANAGVKAATLDPDTVVSNAQFIVGHLFTFSAGWGLTPPGIQVATNQWALTPHWLNVGTNASTNINCSKIYFPDPHGFTNDVVTNIWWVSGGISAPEQEYATVDRGLTFTNGQHVVVPAKGLFNMYKPDAKISPWTTKVTIATNSSGIYLSFSDVAANPAYGITFSNTIKYPLDFTGAVGWIQVDYAPIATRLDNNGTNHDEVLNGPGPYGDYSASSRSILWENIDPDTNLPFDIPGLQLRPDCSRSEASDQLTMWMMFQPPGGVAVPLRAVSWQWHGVATNGPTGWGLQSDPGDHTVNPQDYPTEDYPMWKSSAGDSRWVPPF